MSAVRRWVFLFLHKPTKQGETAVSPTMRSHPPPESNHQGQCAHYNQHPLRVTNIQDNFAGTGAAA